MKWPLVPMLATALAISPLAGVAIAQSHKQHLLQISQDPYTDPSAQHATEVEPVMVANRETIVTAFQVGRFYGAGSDNIGWSTSTDGGKSWQGGFLSGTTTIVGGAWPAVSLANLAYDNKHETYLLAMMPFDDQGNGRGVLVSRSSDGLNWSQPITAASSAGANGHWLACDNSAKSPYFGNCYDAYLDYSSPVANVNNLVVSSDGGVTWGPPVTSPDQLTGLVTSISIQPNGTVIVFGRHGGPNGDQQYAIRSLDGGQTLEPTNDIATIFFDYPYMRADSNPRSAVDSHGRIYAVFPDCRFRSNCTDPVAVNGCRYVTDNTSCPTNDFVLTTSTDGINWSALKRIPIDAVTSSADYLISGLSALSEPHDESDSPLDEDGSRTRLALAYYYVPNGKTCSPDTCLVSAGYITSDDGGASWHRAADVEAPMSQTWLVPTYAGPMVGGYISSVFVDGKPFGAFAIARPPAPTGLLNEAIYAGKLLAKP